VSSAPESHPIERFLGPPSYELKIADVRGQKVFDLTPPREVAVFVEFNGYRKMVTFPADPAPFLSRLPEQKAGG
jgi:hypothetical protein